MEPNSSCLSSATYQPFQGAPQPFQGAPQPSLSHHVPPSTTSPIQGSNEPLSFKAQLLSEVNRFIENTEKSAIGEYMQQMLLAHVKASNAAMENVRKRKRNESEETIQEFEITTEISSPEVGISTRAPLDAACLRNIGTCKVTGSVQQIVLTNQGLFILTQRTPKETLIYKLKDSEATPESFSLGAIGQIGDIAFYDRYLIVSVKGEDKVHFYNVLENFAYVKKFEGNIFKDDTVTTMKVFNDLLVVGTHKGEIFLINLKENKVGSYLCHKNRVTVLSANEFGIISGSTDRYARCYDWNSENITPRMPAPLTVSAVARSEDFYFVAAKTEVRLFNKEIALSATFNFRKCVVDLAMDQNGLYIATEDEVYYSKKALQQSDPENDTDCVAVYLEPQPLIALPGQKITRFVKNDLYVMVGTANGEIYFLGN